MQVKKVFYWLRPSAAIAKRRNQMEMSELSNARLSNLRRTSHQTSTRSRGWAEARTVSMYQMYIPRLYGRLWKTTTARQELCRGQSPQVDMQKLPASMQCWLWQRKTQRMAIRSACLGALDVSRLHGRTSYGKETVRRRKWIFARKATQERRQKRWNLKEGAHHYCSCNYSYYNMIITVINSAFVDLIQSPMANTRNR